jgi:hypothetical protein
MDRAKLLLAGLLKLTPSKSFILGTGLVLLMPESFYSSIALTYHDIAHDNTYTLEASVHSSAVEEYYSAPYTSNWRATPQLARAYASGSTLATDMAGLEKPRSVGLQITII